MSRVPTSQGEREPPSAGRMRIPLLRTLGVQILALMLPPVLVIVGGSLALLTWMANKRAESELATRAEVSVALQADILALPVWNLDEEQISANLRAMVLNPDFVAAAVIAPDGSYLARQSRENANDSRAINLTARAPIRLKRGDRIEDLGVVELILSKEAAQASYARLVTVGALTVLVLVAGIVIIVFAVVRATVLRPLKLVRTAMDAVSRQDWQTVKWRSTNELGRVIESFNEMVAKLEAGELAKRNLSLAEARIARARAEEARAEAASQAKSEFLANVSHELRTPLNAIIGYTQLMREEAQDAGHGSYIADLDNIFGAGQHLLSLINDVLDLSKIEAGRMELFVETFDVAAMVSDVMSVAQPLIVRNDNRAVIDCPADIGLAETDLTKLRQCLVNLLGNAAKFTEHGTVVLSVSRGPGPGPGDGEWLTFAVADTGIGMTEAQLNKLFRPFVQADSNISQRYGGTGLGLSLTWSFSKLLGGTISAESEPGKGSTFRLAVPLRAGEAGKGKVAEVGTAGTVLIIDDDEELHRTVGPVLEAAGLIVHCSTNGEMGVETARNLKPDLILLDVIMPRIDGWRVLASLRGDAETATIPVILTSVNAQRDLGIMLGAVDFLAKPLDGHDLVRTLKRYIGKTPSGTVLVVDDMERDRAPIARVLRRAGLPTMEAIDGSAALEILERQTPSVILLDLSMPRLDGFDLLNRLSSRPEWRDLPVIVVTGRSLSPEDEARLAGAAEQVLRKGSFSAAELLALVRSRLEIADAAGTKSSFT